MPYPIGSVEQVPHAIIGDDTLSSSSSQNAMLNGQPDPLALPKTVSGSGRLHAIMTNDVHALVKSIKDIELEISEYERENKIPLWTEAVISRLNTIDLRKKQLDDDIRLLDLGIVDETKSYGDRAMGKFKHELTFQLNITKYNLETRIANTTCEIDRLQKLLQIRPTKSEMQTMNSIVSDATQTVQHSFTTLKRDVRGLVSLKATEELNEVLKQLNYNDTMGNKVSIDLNNKVESFVRDMHRMRNGIHNIVNQMSLKVDEVEAKTKNLHQNNEHNVALYDKAHSKCQLEIGEFKTELKESQASFDEFKVSTNANLAQIKIDVDRHEANNATTRLQRDADLNRYKVENSEFRVYMGDFTENVKHSIKDARFDVEQMKRNYYDFEAQQKDLVRDVTPFQKTDIDGIFTRTKNKINQIETAIDTSEELANSSDVKSVKVEKLFNSISSDGEALPTMCIELVKRIDSVVGDSGTTKQDVDILLKEMKLLHVELDKLLLVEKEIKADRTEIEKIAKGTVNYEGKLVLLQDNFTRNKVDLDKSVLDIEKFNELIAQSADDLTSEMSLRMDEKQEQIVEQVKDIEENIQIMEKQKEENLMTSNENSMSSQLLKKKKSKKPKKPSDCNDGDENSLTSSQLTSIVIEEKIKDASDEIPTSAIGLTERERREVLDIQTLFMSKICITFEEKCVKEKYVNDIPETTIGHMINCSQRLASFLSTCVDAEMIQKVLKPNLGLGESNYMTEDAALHRRTEKIEEFLDGVMAIVEGNSYNVGPVRNAAREKFFKQLRLALDLFMSKHSQVIVLGTSLFGRMKYPTSSNCFVVEQRPPVMVKLDPNFIQGKFAGNDMTDEFDEQKDTDQLIGQANNVTAIPTPSSEVIDFTQDIGYNDISTVPEVSTIHGQTVNDSILDGDSQSYQLIMSSNRDAAAASNQRPTGKQSTRNSTQLKLPIISNVPLDDPMRYVRSLQTSHSTEVLRGARLPVAYEMKMNRSASVDDFSPNPYVPPSFTKRVKDDNTASLDVIQMLGYDKVNRK